MYTSVFRILTAAAATGIALSPVAASAAVLHPAALADSSSSTPSAGDPDTTITFTVTTGLLSMTAPTSANLTTGTGAPGTTISGSLGSVTVTDDRAALSPDWTVLASETDWTTGGGTSAETIPATDATYDPGDFTTVGTISVAAASTPPIALANTTVPVVLGTAGVGDNSATWDPTIAVAIPAFAVGGDYTGTLAQSVS
jgi:hypothetical protein